MEPRRDGLGVGGGAVSAAHSGALLVRSRVALRRSARNVLRVSIAAFLWRARFASVATVKVLEPVLANQVGGPPAYRRSFYAVLGRIKRFSGMLGGSSLVG